MPVRGWFFFYPLVSAKRNLLGNIGLGARLHGSEVDGVFADSGPSPIGHGPIEFDSNILYAYMLQRTPVAVEVVYLAVMCSYGPVRLLGAFE